MKTTVIHTYIYNWCRFGGIEIYFLYKENTLPWYWCQYPMLVSGITASLNEVFLCFAKTLLLSINYLAMRNVNFCLIFASTPWIISYISLNEPWEMSLQPFKRLPGPLNWHRVWDFLWYSNLSEYHKMLLISAFWQILTLSFFFNLQICMLEKCWWQVLQQLHFSTLEFLDFGASVF